MKNQEVDAWLSITEAANHAGVTHRTMQRWVASDKVLTKMRDSRRLVLKSSLPPSLQPSNTCNQNFASMALWQELHQILHELLDAIPVTDVKNINRRQQIRESLRRLDRTVRNSNDGLEKQ